MSMIEAVAGQTAPIYLLLLIDGALPANSDGTALSMSGMSCVFVVHDSSGNALSIAGAVTVDDTSLWRVKYSPAAADLNEGQFRARVKVTDSGGKIAYFPSAGWDSLIVRPA